MAIVSPSILSADFGKLGADCRMVLYEVYTTVYITPREGLKEQLKKK